MSTGTLNYLYAYVRNIIFNQTTSTAEQISTRYSKKKHVKYIAPDFGQLCYLRIVNYFSESEIIVLSWFNLKKNMEGLDMAFHGAQPPRFYSTEIKAFSVKRKYNF